MPVPALPLAIDDVLVRRRTVAVATEDVPATDEPLPEQWLVRPPEPGRFDPAELDMLPEPVRRYLLASIAPGRRPPDRHACG